MIIIILFLFVVFVLQSFPFFGVVPAIVDEHGNELDGACEGFLVTIINDLNSIHNSSLSTSLYLSFKLLITCIWLAS